MFTDDKNVDTRFPGGNNVKYSATLAGEFLQAKPGLSWCDCFYCFGNRNERMLTQVLGIPRDKSADNFSTVKNNAGWHEVWLGKIDMVTFAGDQSIIATGRWIDYEGKRYVEIAPTIIYHQPLEPKFKSHPERRVYMLWEKFPTEKYYHNMAWRFNPNHIWLKVENITIGTEEQPFRKREYFSPRTDAPADSTTNPGGMTGTDGTAPLLKLGAVATLAYLLINRKK